MLVVCLQDTARFIALAGTEFTGIDALPETVVDSTPVGAEQTGYRNPYAVYGETPAAGSQLDDAPNAAPSPKRRAEERCAAPLPLRFGNVLCFGQQDVLFVRVWGRPAEHASASAGSRRTGEGEQPSPSNSRGATLNSTAQRYAAYRLRAAQGESCTHALSACACCCLLM